MIKVIVSVAIIVFVIGGFYGIYLLAMTIRLDNELSFTAPTNLKYIATLNDASQVIALIWTIVSVLLIFLTFSIQKKQADDNSTFLIKQQFETTFFNMLNVLFNLKMSIHTSKSGTTMGGQEFMDHALEDLKETFRRLSSTEVLPNVYNKIKNLQPVTQVELGAVVSDLDIVYSEFYKEYHAETGHYFRYLYNLIKFVIQQRIVYKDEKVYIDIVQAQLSNSELGLIFYNVISSKGRSSSKKYKFYTWLEKYSFLENIDESSLVIREHNVLYKDTFFKFLNSSEREVRKSIPLFTTFDRL